MTDIKHSLFINIVKYIIIIICLCGRVLLRRNNLNAVKKRERKKMRI